MSLKFRFFNKPQCWADGILFPVLRQAPAVGRHNYNLHLEFRLLRHLILISLLFLSALSKAQNFKGTWEGVYITSDSSFWDNIKLVFIWNQDDGYVVKSYTTGKNKLGKDTIIVCKVDCKIIRPDSLVLSESEILEPTGINPGICFQTMELKYYRGFGHTSTKVAGKWYCRPKESEGNGFIRLRKVSD